MKNLFENAKDFEKYIYYKEYNKNALIFLEGEQCRNVCIVKKGEISITTSTYDSLVEINNLKENEIFGDSLIFSTDNRYLGSIMAVKDTTLCIISKDNWLKLLENKEILKNYLEIVSNKVFKIQSKVKILSQKSIREKILFYLITESKRINKKTIRIKSKESLALFLNVPRPSLSRELIKLKDEGIIDFDRYSITLLDK
ncbi:MAG: Crp/Fnr family transcriptional regulator [Acholeplasmatales bacterium]|nr:Crp/Fnr family transcriptional regulator [Acholeplasmatales bacterium]